jgi:hypothetical protein
MEGRCLTPLPLPLRDSRHPSTCLIMLASGFPKKIIE